MVGDSPNLDVKSGMKWEPRGAWETVENHGPFAHFNDALHRARVVDW